MSDVVETAAEFVTEEATDLAEASRGMSASGVGVGLVIGLVAGGGLGYILARRKLETKYQQFAEEEIDEMRQHYQNKLVALDERAEKAPLEEIIKENGYAVPKDEPPPMAITPPATVVDAVEALQEEEELEEVVHETPPPAPPQDRNVFEEARKAEGWDYHKERSKRSPLRPYVIHRDEREERSAYSEATLTYYEEDDVLCNERDEPIDHAEREKMIGEEHLELFGHGSGDPHIVYIRNDALQLQFEVVRSPNSYAEEVHGFTHSEYPRRRVRRNSFDDE